MNIKSWIKLLPLGLITIFLAACSSTVSSTEDGTDTLYLASNHPEEHPVTPSLYEFSDLVNENTNGQLEINVAANGLLGGERDVVELVKAGTIPMAKVSASVLEGFEDSYSIFSLPYIFESMEHYYDAMDNSEAIQDIFTKTKNQGWFAIGWYSAGQRSIYTSDQKLKTPEDLNGMKIRVQQSPTSIAMIDAMGGAPTPMDFGEVYTSLQQGIIDGAENNIMGLTSNQHGEVAKAYTYTEHQYVPDVLIVSTEAWEGMTDEEKQAVLNASRESSENHKERWETATEEAIQESENMGVTFYEIDTQPFIEAVQPMHEAFKAESEQNAQYYENIKSFTND